MVLGIGIVAPAIGGIPEQVRGYSNCILLDVSEMEKVFLNWNFLEKVQFDYRSSNLEKIKKLWEII